MSINKIPKARLKQVAKISIQTGIAQATLEERLLLAYTDEQALAPIVEKRFNIKLSTVDIWKRAMDTFREQIREEEGLLDGRGQVFMGFLWGSSELKDFVHIMRRSAEYRMKARASDEDPDGVDWGASQEPAYCDLNGKILDRRKKIGFRDNDKFGELLTGTSFARDVYGMTGYRKVEEDNTINMTNIKLTRIIFESEMALNMAIPTFTSIKFRSTEQKKGKFIANYRTLRAFEGTLPFKAIDYPMDHQKLIQTHCNVIQVHQLIQVVELMPTIPVLKQTPGKVTEMQAPRGNPQDLIVVQGIAGKVNATVHPTTKNKSLTLDNEILSLNQDRGVLGYVPEHIPFDFGRYSHLYTLCWVRGRKYGGKLYPEMNVYGVYALPSHWRPPARVQESTESRGLKGGAV